MVRWALEVTRKDQDKKRICEKDRENRKAGRQTSKYKTTLVWTREKERRRLPGKEMMEMAVPRRYAKEKVWVWREKT